MHPLPPGGPCRQPSGRSTTTLNRCHRGCGSKLRGFGGTIGKGARNSNTGINPFTTGNPFFGDKIICIRRGSGALKGLSWRASRGVIGSFRPALSSVAVALSRRYIACKSFHSV